ncbi:MAG: ATP phosphoribosyltransferase [Atopobiaceae bacterium]|nr:ATP phosphoribosyltransferase [Atopobiaceae bacterium]MCI2172944.1 ATP phosphoribosyltransferase [Atopobiaceae bacterium]MCI2208349.1 ATP phosphoribosyltransferase [Atopobiaceae bacterium]
MIAGTPRGFRDILPAEAEARERISDTVRDCFSRHGYHPVETPLLEDRDVLERGGRIKGSPFQLFDSDDRLLTLRPDITLPIARMAATRLRSASGPQRLRYAAPVVREQASLKGQPRQFTQLGVELIGGEGLASEYEVVSLLAEVLDTLGVKDWHVVCGSVTPLVALLDRCVSDPLLCESVLACVHGSDLVGLDQLVDASDLDEPVARALKGIARVHGDDSVIDDIDSLLAGAGVPMGERGTLELRELVCRLSDVGRASRVTFDFSIINSFDYYTGIVFKGYADGIAASLASGGRYDAVLANMGLPDTCACGFALSLERLQEVLGEQGEAGVATPGVSLGERPLRIAVPKGSLNSDTIDALEACGLPVQGLRDPGRKLIIPAGDVEYVIVRPTDAPAFVGFGGADCGICGSDSLIEADLDLLQLVDLRYGACRFIVAEPRANAGMADRAYSWRGTIRVATKYPRITQMYYDRMGVTADILALHGNIELGPIVGMADRIVDITATGTTLAENDLVVVDDVMECTARFFAGPAAYRCDSRIRDLADRLAEVTGRSARS